MSKVNFFAQGMGLKPLSADPASPSDGQLQMADGTVRAAGLYRYSSASVAWIAVGSGGGGLDVFHTENFESNGASDFTSGNASTVDAAGTGTLDGVLSDETSAPISSDASLEYVMGSSSTNDFFLQDADIALENKQLENDIGISFYYSYTGDDDDLRFFVLDQDDNELTSTIEFLKKSTSATRFTTSVYIPAGSTGLRYGFQVETGNSGESLLVDDVELSLNPFVYKNLSNDSAWIEEGVVGIDAVTTAPTKGTIVRDRIFYRRKGDTMEIRVEYEQSSAGASGSGTYLIDIPNSQIMDSDKVLTTGSGNLETILGICSVSTSSTGLGSTHRKGIVVPYSTTQVALQMYVPSGENSSPFDSGTFGLGANSSLVCTALFEVPIDGWEASSEHVITPAKSNMTDWIPFTPVLNGGGVTSAKEGFYRRVGGSLEMKVSITTGTPSGTVASIDIPALLNVDTSIITTDNTLHVGGGFNLVGSSTALTSNLLAGYLKTSTTDKVYITTTSNSGTFEDRAANGILSSSSSYSFEFKGIPIAGWNSDATFLAAIPTTNTIVKIIDGVTAPGTENFAQMYIDSTDGDLKIKFADGTVKTITTDT